MVCELLFPIRQKWKQIICISIIFRALWLGLDGSIAVQSRMIYKTQMQIVIQPFVFVINESH